MRKSLVFLSLILLVYSVWAQSTRRTASATASIHFPPAAIAAFQKIDAERIRAHVRFLSHDLLEGRGTASAAVTSRPNTSPRNFRYTD